VAFKKVTLECRQGRASVKKHTYLNGGHVYQGLLTAPERLYAVRLTRVADSLSMRKRNARMEQCRQNMQDMRAERLRQVNMVEKMQKTRLESTVDAYRRFRVIRPANGKQEA